MWKFILSLFKGSTKTTPKAKPKKTEREIIEEISKIIQESEMSSAKNPDYKVTLKEFLKGRANFDKLDADIQKNIEETLEKINKVRNKYGKAMKVNDGLRIKEGYKGSGAPTSKHFKGQAIDIDDNDAGDFAIWCIANLDFLASVGLFMEDFRWTNGCGSWVHFQTVPPRSGKRVFIPNSSPACNPKLWDGKYDKKLNV